MLVPLKHGALRLSQNFNWKHCKDFPFIVGNVCSSEEVTAFFQWNALGKETLWAIFAFIFQPAVVPVQAGIHQSATATPEHRTATSNSSNDHVQITFFLLHSLLCFLPHASEWGFKNSRQSISPCSGSRRTGVVVKKRWPLLALISGWSLFHGWPLIPK